MQAATSGRFSLAATAKVRPAVALSHSSSVTIAVAVIGVESAAAAADSQEVTLHGRTDRLDYTVGTTVKTISGAHGIGVLAGFTRFPSGHLADPMRSALAAPGSLRVMASVFAERAANLVGPHQEHLTQLAAAGDIVWEAVIVDRNRAAARLTCWNRRGTLELDAVTIEGALPPRVVVLGARHPLLRRYDVRYHEDHPNLVWAAQLTRGQLPEPPLALRAADDPAAAAVTLVERAVASENLADRPAAWPAGVPVASGPVTFERL